MSDEATKILFGYGPLGVILVALAFAAWAAARAAFVALLSEEPDKHGRPRGLLRKVADAHLEAMDRLISAQQSDRELLRELVGVNRRGVDAAEEARDGVAKLQSIAAETFAVIHEKFAVMAGYMAASAQRARVADAKRVFVLLVEDNPVDARLIRDALAPAAAEHGLTLKEVRTVAEAQEVLECARVVVLDVTLPDAHRPGTVNMFVSLCVGYGAAVVVYSGDAWSDADFPAAYRVLKKGDREGLTRAVRELLQTR